MASIPEPRKPTCHKHHAHMTSCPDCMQQVRAEREAASKRLDQAAR